jgi:hypothetical protein
MTALTAITDGKVAPSYSGDKLRTSGIIETDRRGHFRIVAPERLRDLTQPPTLSRL